MAAGAIGTDTGGSVRIPSALNGLVGFKPTARRVPLDGVLPLSFTLDSAGPIAKTVADCALLDQVLAAEAEDVPAPAHLRGLRLAVPVTVFQNDLSPAVADTFKAALARLSAAGATVVPHVGLKRCNTKKARATKDRARSGPVLSVGPRFQG